MATSNDQRLAAHRLRLLAAAENEPTVRDQLMIAADKYDSLASSLEALLSGPRLSELRLKLPRGSAAAE
jgi:hypothetical protein